MIKQAVRFAFVLSTAFLIGAPPCLAKTKGYLYVVCYSNAQKKVYLSEVFIQKVREISYSEDEYVTEVEIIQKVESKFHQHLASAEKLNLANYTTAVKGAFKHKPIAEMRVKSDKERYQKAGYTVVELDIFE